MKAIILAAGRGSRLKELTSGKPKCLNKLGGHPLINWQITALRKAGVEEIVIVNGYQKEKLDNLGYKTFFNKEWESTQMVYSLLCAKTEFVNDIIVSYSDILYESKVVAKLLESEREISVVYDKEWRNLWEDRFDSPLDDAESFRISEEGQITEIGKSVDNINCIQGQYVGLLRFSSKFLKKLIEMENKNKELYKKMDMTSLLQHLIQNSFKIYGVPIKGGWCEVDTEKDLKVATELLNRGKLKIK